MKANHSMHLHKANTPMYPAPNLRTKIIIRIPETPSKGSGTSQSLPTKGNHYPDFYCTRNINFTCF